MDAIDWTVQKITGSFRVEKPVSVKRHVPDYLRTAILAQLAEQNYLTAETLARRISLSKASCGKLIGSASHAMGLKRVMKRIGGQTRKALDTSMTPLEYIRSRCKTVGDCWIWTGCLNGANHPSLNWQGKHWCARRFALQAVRRPPNNAYVAIDTFGVKLCCNPDHLRWARRSDPVFVDPLKTASNRLKSAALQQKTGRGMGLENARKLRSMDLRTRDDMRQAGQEIGVGLRAVQHALAGNHWRDPMWGGLA